MKLEDAYPTPFSIHGEGLDPSSFLHSIESPFQVQEYIALLVRADPHDVDQIVSLPSPSSHSNHQSTPATPTTSPLVPQEVWIYEQLRRFSQDLSHPFVSTLQSECSRTTCPEMKAGEWLYLCAAHATANENDCCAIDYIVHTLDGATALLNSARYFPSRLQIPTTSIKHFTSIARRLYRIFAHAWFHHRDVFDQCETETSLYARFLALTDRFSLISEDLLVIPRMNGEEEREEEEGENESSGSGEKQETMDDDELEELE
ncbi:Mob1/phocein [Melampsora americana]|nr:Mob1/phocein [Melampsora americana]